jgi:hypothetical protein
VKPNPAANGCAREERNRTLSGPLALVISNENYNFRGRNAQGERFKMSDQKTPALGKARRSLAVRFAIGVIVVLVIQVPLTFFAERILELRNPDALNSIKTFQDEVWTTAQSLSPIPVLMVFGSQYSKAEPGCLKQGLYGMVCTIVSATILTPAQLARDANTVGAWFMVIGMICVVFGAIYATVLFTSKAAPYWYAYFSIFCLLGMGAFTCACLGIQLIMLAGELLAKFGDGMKG